MIKNLVNLFKMVWCAFFNEEAEKSEVYDIIPAIGWEAVFANAENGIITRPVIFWEIAHDCDNIPLTAVGMVFVDNKPPYVEQTSENPHFIGYQRVSSNDTSSLELAYKSFNEWS